MLCEEFIRAKAAAMAPVRQSNKPRKKPRGAGGEVSARRDRSLSWEDLTPLCPPRPPLTPAQQQRDPDAGDRRRQLVPPGGGGISSAARRSFKCGPREHAGPGKSSSPFIVIPGGRPTDAGGGRADGAASASVARWMSPTSFSLRYDDIHVGSVEGAGPAARPERAGHGEASSVVVAASVAAASVVAGRDKAASRHDAAARHKLFHGGKDVPGDSLLLMAHPGSNSAGHSESLLNNYLRKKMEEIERAMLLSPGSSPQSVMARFQHLSLYNTEPPSLAAAGLEIHERMGEDASPSVLSTPVLQISEENAQDVTARLRCGRPESPPPESTRADGFVDSGCSTEGDAMTNDPFPLSLTGGQRLKSDSISKMLQRSISLPSLPALAVAPASSATTLELYDQPTLAVLQRCRSVTEYLRQFTSWDRDSAGTGAAQAAAADGAPGSGLASFSGELDTHDLQISYGRDDAAP